MTRCEWMFHGVTRTPNGDGTVTLTLDGWRYTSNAERDPGGTSTCRWCHQPISRTCRPAWRRDWRSAYGEECGESGPDGFHSPEPLPQVAAAPGPCVTRTVSERSVDCAGVPYRVVESAEAGELVREHCGEMYTVVWQGKGWSVEIRSGYPLWQMTG